MSRPCGDHLVTSRPEKNYLHSIKTHLLDIHILKLHHLHLLRDIVSKICYCRSYRSLSVTGFDRNGLVPYSNASSIKAIIWSDFVIIAIATLGICKTRTGWLRMADADGGWENADGKMRMEKCGWKNADEK